MKLSKYFAIDKEGNILFLGYHAGKDKAVSHFKNNTFGGSALIRADWVKISTDPGINLSLSPNLTYHQ